LHLTIQQRLAIGGLELLQVIGTAGIPVADLRLVAGANWADFQVVADLAKPELVDDDAMPEPKDSRPVLPVVV
jgi:hypothetical protein